MKKSTISLLLLCITFGADAQIFSEDFESVTAPNLPAGWSVTTYATDGGYLTGDSSSLSSAYFNIPSHTNFIGTNDDACNCDKSADRLITPSIDLSTVSSAYLTVDLYFYEVYWGGPFESARIQISIDGGLNWTDLFYLYNGDTKWQEIVIDLTSYAGQSNVLLSFLYNDYGNWRHGLMIDNLMVFEVPPVDLEMNAITSDTAYAAGSYYLTGVIKSWGEDTVTSVDIIWNDGTGNQVYTFPTLLGFGDTASFTHPTPITLSAGQIIPIDVSVLLPGDTITTNNSIGTSFVGVSSVVPKKVVGELHNGTWCGWNPRGDVSLAKTAMENPTNFIGIAVHSGDPMEIPAYNDGIFQYLPTYLPRAAVDRLFSTNLGGYESGKVEYDFPLRVNHVPPASISVNAISNGSAISVDVSANMVMSLSGDYRLAVVLVHDSLSGIGYTWAQQNYYAGGANGPLTMPNYGSMPNFAFHMAPNPVPYTSCYHDFVAVGLGNNEINGQPGSLPSNLIDGNTYSYSYSFTILSKWSPNRMRAVGMLINGKTGEILNAEQSDVTGLGIAEDYLEESILIGPNPNNGLFAISIELPENLNVEISVINAAGETVYKENSIHSQNGILDHIVDMRNEAAGLYILQAKTSKGIVSRKINIIH